MSMNLVEIIKWRLSTDGSLVCEDDWPNEPADENYDYQHFEFPLEMEREEVELELIKLGHDYII